MLVYFLIFLFTILLTFQIFNNVDVGADVRFKEGFDDASNSTASAPCATDLNTLVHKNAAEIDILKNQMGELKGGKDQVVQNTKDIAELQKQVQAYATAQTQPISNATSPPPNVTGLNTGPKK